MVMRQEAPPPAHGLNPPLAVANPLLMLVPQVRATRQADPASLRASLAHGIREFATQAGKRPSRRARDGCPLRAVHHARRNRGRHALGRRRRVGPQQPAGGVPQRGVRRREGVPADGALAEKPDVNLDLLELIYAATALGFRPLPRRRQRAGAAGGGAHASWPRSSGSSAAPTRRRWPSTGRAQAAERRGLLAAAGAGRSGRDAAAGPGYAAFAWSLAGKADPVFSQIQGLRLNPPVAGGAARRRGAAGRAARPRRQGRHHCGPRRSRPQRRHRAATACSPSQQRHAHARARAADGPHRRGHGQERRRGAHHRHTDTRPSARCVSRPTGTCQAGARCVTCSSPRACRGPHPRRRPRRKASPSPATTPLTAANGTGASGDLFPGKGPALTAPPPPPRRVDMELLRRIFPLECSAPGRCSSAGPGDGLRHLVHRAAGGGG